MLLSCAPRQVDTGTTRWGDGGGHISQAAALTEGNAGGDAKNTASTAALPDDDLLVPGERVPELHEVSVLTTRGPGSFKFDERCPEWGYRRPGSDEWHYWPARPAAQLEPRPKHSPPRGGIVVLARKKSVAIFKVALARLDKYLNDRYGFPVVVFHDDLEPSHEEELRAATRSTLTFEQIAMCVPEFLKPLDVPEYAGDSPVGYRHMMRLFAFKLFAHPALDEFDYYWRMDTDSYLSAPVTDNLFERMAERHWKYSFLILWRDSAAFLMGLAPEVHSFMRDAKIDPDSRELWKLLVFNEADFVHYDGCHFWNNFEVVDLDFVRSEAYWALATRVDESGIMYKYRVGDAPIRTLAAAALLQPNEVGYMNDISYQHQAQYFCALDSHTDEYAEEHGLPPKQQLANIETRCDVDVNAELHGTKCHKKLVDEKTGVEQCKMVPRTPCAEEMLGWTPACTYAWETKDRYRNTTRP